MNKVDRGANDYELLKRVLGRLQCAGFSPLVFGGWAQELLQLARPRSHLDVDLLRVWIARIQRAGSQAALERFPVRWNRERFHLTGNARTGVSCCSRHIPFG
jgi:hypothetical protein